MMNPVVHFEMPAEDKERVAAFYEQAFGWKMKVLGAEVDSYVLASTTESDEQGMPLKPARINGGFYTKSKEAPHPSVVIAVLDIQDAIKKIMDAGGEIIGHPRVITGYGIYIAFLDTEGNRVGVMQPTM